MNTALAVVAVLFGLSGFVAGILALRTLSRLRRSVALLSRGSSGRETILEVADKHMAASEAVRKDILDLQRDLVAAQQSLDQRVAGERADLSGSVAGIAASVSTALRRVALVRYDAFDDLSGRLSFSLAIMDDNGNGITLTSIASATENRVYAKSLSGGHGEHPLSPEEEQAVRAALRPEVRPARP
ncbi:DUF4446 family protein [Jatrophihabitans telluris]|uniref:DUF4446 family protein n=1 Tax=Jatrophihabitans telluris TaxID=2038343 RepID=A0ABY4QY29_9ACTN|nr:DUF4446 family protein [Jatrophihabitans telluris]UQX88586.1 DUF4446 family protein [Jatrophihabitans telluris]